MNQTNTGELSIQNVQQLYDDEELDDFEDEDDMLQSNQSLVNGSENDLNLGPRHLVPRKLLIYSDNLRDFEPQRLYIRSLRGPIEDMEIALRDTLNLSLMASASFRFDPALNLLEITDTRFPRWTAIQTSHSKVRVEAKLYILASGYDVEDCPYSYIMRQALSALERQLGIRRVDLLILSFSGINMVQVEENEESATDFSRFLDNIMGIWSQGERYIHYGRIVDLGVANFSPWQMELLYKKVKVRPAMNHIRFQDDTQVIPPQVLEHAEKNGYGLSLHEDRMDPLTDIMFAEMNRDFLVNQKFPTIEIPSEGSVVDIMFPRWAMSYIVTNNETEVIESRGYIAMISSDNGRDPDQI
ncbi:hypothetical protein H4219_000571 [Mycoemilia scoparia]|uniref:GCS light chain n=1 Tax=Mycoemilia scoparia TaxID=417184 RepID=A0A9W8A2I0_9FUNG|nr:hypothetical protein H4219_000571 [Mycoemilia scoparia]